MNRIIAGVATVLALVLACAASTILIVDERTYVIVSTLGKAQPRFIRSPGLHFRWPPPFSQVVRLSKRMQAFNRSDALRIRSADQKEMGMRWGIQWRITNPQLYFDHFGHLLRRAESQLSKQTDAAARALASQRPAMQLITESHQIGRAIRERVALDARRLGIEIINVPIIALDSEPDSLASRMETQYKQLANRLRSAGGLEAAEIRTAAEHARQERIAQAYQQAQTLKGEGEAQVALIDADAYRRDPKFYRFYKSLEAYRKSFSARDVIVVDLSSDFFRFMRSPKEGDR